MLASVGEPAEPKTVTAADAEQVRQRAFAVVRMVYQPIFDLRSGQVHGFEALARFNVDPPRKPEAVFADAAAAGVGIDLECHAIRLAAAALPRLPHAMRLSVNGSPAAVASGKVALCLRNFDCTRVTVELTEHSEVEDYSRLELALVELRSIGVRIAVDDAGAGVSRLPHITKVWPDVIKLDRSLIVALATGAEAAGHSRAVVNFAEEFKIQVVAEGIENVEELEAVKRLRVRYGQGFLLGEPRDVEEWRTALHLS
jgi:EAL domain-containing protein (putative c-di-GMP-specific phosphodiesterase class I)